MLDSNNKLNKAVFAHLTRRKLRDLPSMTEDDDTVRDLQNMGKNVADDDN